MDRDDENVSKRVTMRDVAALAGVPVSAVALALQGKPGVSPSRRSAVLRAAEEVGYARATRTATPPLIGLVMEELSPVARADGFVDTLIQGVFSAARNQGAQVLLGMYRPGSDPVGELRSLAGRPLDGLLIANGGDVTTEVIDGLVESHLPTVLIENRIERPISSVSGDNFTAGMACTAHLLERGHRRIGMIRGSERYHSLESRFHGYLAALGKAGIAPDPSLIRAPAPHGTRKGYEETLSLLETDNPPTAIYAVSDKTAYGAAAALYERGLKVGEDIALIGTDNVYSSADQPVALSTYDTNSGMFGAVAMRRLLSTLANEPVTHTVLAGQLVVRESSAREQT